MSCSDAVSRSYYATFVMNLRPWPWLSLLVPLACASAAARDSGGDVAVVRHVDRVAAASASVPLAGARCRGSGGSCVCPAPRAHDEGTGAPAHRRKRFEAPA